jgi:SAM-dependent methyltransferase
MGGFPSIGNMSGNNLENWDKQIRLFAKYFLAHAALPKHLFTLLDGGCGTGSALREIRKIYPYAKLIGCDLEREHIKIAEKRNRRHGVFVHEDIRNISNFYDFIYVSNVLEHIEDWTKVVKHLLSCCRRLYVLVPHREIIRDGRRRNINEIDHVNSFDKNSFDHLVQDGLRIESRVIRTPGAWGHSRGREMIFRLKAFLNGDRLDVQRQILFAITNLGKRNDVIPQKAFWGRFRVFLNLINLNRETN